MSHMARAVEESGGAVRKPLSLRSKKYAPSRGQETDKENIADFHNRSSGTAQHQQKKPLEGSADETIDHSAHSDDNHTQCTCGKAVRRNSLQHSKICLLFKNQQKHTHKHEQNHKNLSRTPPFMMAMNHMKTQQRRATPPPSPSLSLRGLTPDYGPKSATSRAARRTLPAAVDEEYSEEEDNIIQFQTHDVEDIENDDDNDDSEFTPDVLRVRRKTLTIGASTTRPSASPMVVLAYQSSSDEEDELEESLRWPAALSGQEGASVNSEVWEEDSYEEDDIVIPCSQPRQMEENDDSQVISSEDEDDSRPESDEARGEINAEAEGIKALLVDDLHVDSDDEDIFTSQQTMHQAQVDLYGSREEPSPIEEEDPTFESFVDTESIDDQGIVDVKASHKSDEGEESSVPISEGTEEDISVEGKDGVTTEAPNAMIEHAEHATASEHHSTPNEEDDALLLLLRSLRLECYHSRFVLEEVSLGDVALLTDEELERHLGLRLGPRRRLRHALSLLQLPPAFSSAEAKHIQEKLNKKTSS